MRRTVAGDVDETRLQQPDFKHPVTRWAGVAAFHSASTHEDGVHVIGSGAARQIELLLGGNPFQSSGTPVLVVFSGAITSRETKVPPFFSGGGLAASTGHPFIAISDPGLELSSRLSIAWYAGSALHDTRSILIDLLGPLAARLGKELWLVGGSAGGFAALAMGHSLPGSPSVFTWNPQTDLLGFTRSFVVDYLTSAFPISATDLAGPDYQDVGREVLRRHGAVPSLLESLPSQGPGRLLYLQNSTDTHFLGHCRPYLRSQGYSRYGRGIWRRDREHVIWVADVAPGHNPPPRDQLVGLLHRFTHSSDDVLTTVRQFEGVDYFGDPRHRRPEPLTGLAEEIAQRVDIRWDGHRVQVHSDLPEGFGGITWTASRHTRNGGILESSPVQESWTAWAPDSADAQGTIEVTLIDGFGDEILTRQVIC